ncbi:MAG TPA: glycoside hydrolase family 16 protein, partial [Bacteroidota bacterium]|nr:glycoside hydrolase family 16 protein [Bacteroidota bacterium]
MKKIVFIVVCCLGVGILTACNKKSDSVGVTPPVDETAIDGWTLVWNDEFDTGTVPSPDKWSFDVGGSGWGNNE